MQILMFNNIQLRVGNTDFDATALHDIWHSGPRLLSEAQLFIIFRLGYYKLMVSPPSYKTFHYYKGSCFYMTVEICLSVGFEVLSLFRYVTVLRNLLIIMPFRKWSTIQIFAKWKMNQNSKVAVITCHFEFSLLWI